MISTGLKLGHTKKRVHSLRVPDSTALRKIFGHTAEGVTGDWK